MRRSSMYADRQRLVTCLSSDMSFENVKPRFLAEDEKGTSAFPTRMEVGAWSGSNFFFWTSSEGTQFCHHSVLICFASSMF